MRLGGGGHMFLGCCPRRNSSGYRVCVQGVGGPQGAGRRRGCGESLGSGERWDRDSHSSVQIHLTPGAWLVHGAGGRGALRELPRLGGVIWAWGFCPLAGLEAQLGCRPREELIGRQSLREERKGSSWIPHPRGGRTRFFRPRDGGREGWEGSGTPLLGGGLWSPGRGTLSAGRCLALLLRGLEAGGQRPWAPS